MASGPGPVEGLGHLDPRVPGLSVALTPRHVFCLHTFCGVCELSSGFRGLGQS